MRRSPDHLQLCERARHHLRHATWQRVATPEGEIQTYTLLPDSAAPAGTVLLVHGWTSEASFMTALAEPLRRLGMRVCLFDFPAHGLSAGRRIDIAGCARAMYRVVDALGPMDHVVAHSFGGVVALWVGSGGAPLPGAMPARSYVLISCPDLLSDVTAEFACHHAMTDAGRRAYEHRLERIAHRPLQEISAARFLAAIHRPAVLIHASDDHEVPITNSRRIADACPGVELIEVDHLGHRSILSAPPVMRAVMNAVRMQS